MEALYERCCGLDVHRNMMVACLPIIESFSSVDKRFTPFAQ